MTRELSKKKLKTNLTIILLLTFIFACMGYSIAHAAAPTATGLVNSKNGVVLRSKASTKAKKVKTLKNNAKLVIHKEVYIKKNKVSAKQKWYYVTGGGKKGYIRSDLVDTVKYTEVNGYTTDSLNYRVGPNTKMKRVGTLKKNASVKIVLAANVKGVKKVWYKVKINSKYYYVSSDYIKFGTLKSTASKSSTTATTASGPISLTGKDITYPESILEGQPFSLRGTFECNKPIQKVKFGVTDSSGKWVITKEMNVNANTFAISKVDTSIKFGTLSPGSYTYVGVLTVNGTNYTKVKYAFTVRKCTGADKLAATAVKLAWPYGTSKSVYGSKPTDAYKAALDSVYPNHNSWGKGPNTGASCDVFIGTVCGASGVDKNVPRSLNAQWTYFSTHPDKWVRISYSYKESELKSGDIFIYQTTSGVKHVGMYLRINGKGYCAEASYPRALYGFINTATAKLFKSSDKVKFEVYRPNF